LTEENVNATWYSDGSRRFLPTLTIDLTTNAVGEEYPVTFHRLIFGICLVYFAVLSAAQAEVFYVNSRSGQDSNAGTSPDTPRASLQAINERVFKPGDRILLAARSQFTGRLEPKGCGTAAAPICLSRYGEGPNPAIHGAGKAQYTLLLHNVEYWEVRDLEITNRGAHARGGRRGVIISAEDFGDCHHIVLEGLEIHDVNGSLRKRDGGGGSAILWTNGGEVTKTRFIDLRILNCHIHDCARNAINSRGYSRRNAWHPSLQVVIRGNLIENVPGDGIVPIATEGALVEYNVIRKGVDSLPAGDAAAGIWPWSSDHTLIQFNEVSDHRAKWDGQGFDADFNCVGTTIQYNYSHDNWGGFLLICNQGQSYGSPLNLGTKDTVVRYNLSVNDGLRPYQARNKRFFSPIFHISGPTENTRIDHNIIIMPPKPNPQIENTVVEASQWGGPFPKSTYFTENVVRNPNGSAMNWGKSAEVMEDKNDNGRDFPFEERNPLKILSHFENHPLFRHDAGFRIMRDFIRHRLRYPDPRFAQGDAR